jgi:hypothetical protein
MTREQFTAERKIWLGLGDDTRAHLLGLAHRRDPEKALFCAENLGLELSCRNITDLRRVMGVIEDRKIMTPERFREILAQFAAHPGWSSGDVARFLSRDQREVRRWASGQEVIDPEAGDWLEFQAAHPPPKRQPREAEPADTEGFSRS